MIYSRYRSKCKLPKVFKWLKDLPMSPKNKKNRRGGLSMSPKNKKTGLEVYPRVQKTISEALEVYP